MRSSNDFINDRSVLAVQGNKGAALVTLYFDQETGLLTRAVRSTPSPGRTAAGADGLFGLPRRGWGQASIQMDDDVARRPVEFRVERNAAQRCNRCGAIHPAGTAEALLDAQAEACALRARVARRLQPPRLLLRRPGGYSEQRRQMPVSRVSCTGQEGIRQ